MGKYEDMLRDYREKQTGETQQTQQPTAQQQTPASARVGGALLYGQTGRQTAPSDPYSAMLADYRRRNGQPQQAQTPVGQSAGVGSALLAGSALRAPKTPEQRVQELIGLPPEQRVQAVMDLIPIKKNGDYSDAERIWDATKGVGYRAAGSYYRAATDAVLNPSEMLGTSMGSVMAPSLLGVVEAAQKAKNEGRNLSLSDISNAAAAPFSMDALSQQNGRSMLWNLAEEWKKNTPRWEARQDKAHELISKGDELQQKASEGLGFLGKLGIDVYSGALDMLPDMALNTLVPGAGTAAMVTRAYGGSADRARANGADWGEQILYGAAHAAISYGTEKISGIGSLRGEAGFIDNLVEKGVDRFVAHGGNRIIGRMIAGFGSEATEEALEDVFDYWVDKALRAISDGFDFTDGDFDWAGMFYDAFVGGLLGFGGGAVEGVRSNGTARDFRSIVHQSAEESYQLHMGEYIINQLYEGKPGNDTFIADVLGNKDARAALELMMGQPLTGPIGQQIETVQAFAEGLRSDAGNVTNALAALLQNTQNTEAPQEAAGEPVPQGGTEIAPTGAETPTAPPALLNSQQGAEAAQGALPPLEEARRSDNGEKPAALAEMQAQGEAEQSIDERARQIYETPYEDEFYGTQQREDWDSTGEGAKLWAYLEAYGVDSNSLEEGSGAESRAFYELLDLLDHGGDLPASAAAQAFAEAKANGKMDIPKIVSRAYEIAGKEMPSGVRSQYAPTAQDRVDRAKLDERYAKEMASYFDTLAKKAEREGNTEYAQQMRQRAAEERAKAKEAARIAKEARAAADAAKEAQDPSAALRSAQDDSAETGLVPAGQSMPEAQSGTESTPVDTQNPALPAQDGAGIGGPAEPGEPGGPLPGQKRSRTESNTEQYVAGRLGGEQSEVYYTPKSERESLTNAINRVNSDFTGEMQRLSDKPMWTGEDIDTALTIYGFLQLDGVQTGDFSAAQTWGRLVAARGTESGRALQAFSKWTRSGAAAAAKSLERLLEAENLSEEQKDRIANDVYTFAAEYDAIEDGDLGRIRDLIKRQARYRNTWTFGKKGFERMLNEITDFDWLKEYALRQQINIPADYTEKADLGRQVKTWQVNAQLSRLGTFFRNIGGNGVFGIQDTLSQDFFGVALDALLGKFTGKRTLGLDKGWLSSAARKGARQGMVRSILEVAGDVDMSDGGSKYDQTANRTFKMTGNAFDRLMSRWEQVLGYSLTTSDRTFRGGIEAEQERGLSRFENDSRYTNTAEDTAEAAKNMADYRLFQNHGWAYDVSKGLHDIGNRIAGFGGEVRGGKRTGGFGLGDLAMPYPGVPANLGVKALEHSPLNIGKGIYEMVKLLNDAQTGGKIDVKQQQNAVMDVARGLHGSALMAGLIALFKAGLFRNADDEDDKDAKALANAEGRQGVQVNLSAIMRWLQGGDREWKDGDKLMKIDWLEPMNAFLSIASLAADESDLPGYISATFNGTLQSILDMPAMESISNVYDNYRYSKGETVMEKMGDVALGFAADSLTGLLPAPFSQTARAIDPYYRETAGETAAETALRRVMNAIPGLRQMLPEKLDNFGRPKEQADSAYDRWMNSFVRPGQITDYKLGDVEQALDAFAERTGEAVYPKRKPPNSFSFDGGKIQMTGEEKRAYQEAYGQAALQYYGEILLGDAYKNASDGEKQWLLDQAEAYATYQARKAILERRGQEYSNDSWDKVDALEEAGGNPFDYLFTKESVKNAVEAKDFSAVDALLGGLGMKDEATRQQLYDDVSRLDDREEAYRSGIGTETWTAAYEQYNALNKTEGMTATDKAIAFDQYLQRQVGLNGRQKALLREQFGFYNISRGRTDTYDKLTGAGLSPDKAAGLYDAVHGLQPLPGKSGVNQNQKIWVIANNGSLTEEEKWAALEIYASDACYKKAMEAKAKGKSYAQWAQEYTKGEGADSGTFAPGGSGGSGVDQFGRATGGSGSTGGDSGTGKQTRP